MSTILVTGGAGYIGSHTAKRLAAMGRNVVVLDNLSTGHRDLARYGDLLVGDLLDPAALDQAFEGRRVEAVLHFAAASQVGESVRQPLRYYQNNMGGALALLAAMRRHGVRRLVFSSSCSVYGPPFEGLLTEDHPLGPLSPYAWTKRMMEQAMADMAANGELDYVALRYFNAAGADPEGELGERHEPETHLIPLLLQAALGLRGELELFGTDYPTSDGTAIRDYIHVQDLAEAHVSALAHLERGGQSGPVNLGNGQGHSVRQVIEAARAVTGVDIPVRTAPRRAGDSPRLVGDATKARAMLGFRPAFPDIRDIIATAWAWHRTEARRKTEP